MRSLAIGGDVLPVGSVRVSTRARRPARHGAARTLSDTGAGPLAVEAPAQAAVAARRRGGRRSGSHRSARAGSSSPRRSAAKADAAEHERQPEEDHAVGEHGRGGRGGRQAVDDHRADQPAVDPADPARDREQPAELADQVAHQHERDRRRLAEGLEARPDDGVVEGPVAERAGDHLPVAPAQDRARLAHAVVERRGDRVDPAPRARPGLPGAPARGRRSPGRRPRGRSSPRRGSRAGA